MYIPHIQSQSLSLSLSLSLPSPPSLPLSLPPLLLFTSILLSLPFPPCNTFPIVPAIYDITICSRDDDPSLMDIVNANPSTADVYCRLVKIGTP